MKKLPNAVKWLIILAVLALMGWMLVQVNDRASRVKMPDPDNSLGIYRQTPATGKGIKKTKRDCWKAAPLCFFEKFLSNPPV